MIVSCQNCNARFNLEDRFVKESGSKVRCSKCKHIFFVFPEKAPESDSPLPEAPLQEAFSAKAHDAAGLSKTASGLAPSIGEELDLSEIEKMLETASGDKAPEALSASSDTIDFPEDSPPKIAATAASEGVLDLSEIEKILEMDQDSEDAFEIGPEPEELIFDLEESVDGEKPRSDFGDFDLSDIEKMLEQEDDETEAAAENLSLGLESSLDTLMETTSKAADAPKTDVEPEPFKLEMADQDLPLAAEAPAAAADELDFSGLEEMMAEEASGREEPKSGIEDLVLNEETGELSLSLGDDEASEMAPASDAANELDLSALNDALKAAPDKPVAEDEELSLELEMAQPESESTGAGGEPELVFDEEVGAGESDEDDLPMATEDLNLEFDESPLDHVPAVEAEEAEDKAAVEPADDPGLIPIAGSDQAEAVGMPIPAKKRRNKPVVIVIILILLICAAGLGYVYVSKNGIQIPFLSGSQPVEPADRGNLHIATVDVDSRFIEQSQIGRLFVITGNVRNDYPDARSFVRIIGRLFTQGKKLANTETVFCGNTMSDLELSTAALETIRGRLRNRSGDGNANVNIRPGESRPFMIVFSNLPDKLEEFTLEIAESQPAGQGAQK